MKKGGEDHSRILVIEDEPKLRKLLRRLMEFEHFEVVEAENGKKGLALENRMSLDLVITDIIMPEAEGLEVIRTIKNRNPDLKIVAISGGGSLNGTDCLAWAEILGAERTFEKPFNFRELLTAVNELLGIETEIDHRLT